MAPAEGGGGGGGVPVGGRGAVAPVGPDGETAPGPFGTSGLAAALRILVEREQALEAYAVQV